MPAWHVRCGPRKRMLCPSHGFPGILRARSLPSCSRGDQGALLGDECQILQVSRREAFQMCQEWVSVLTRGGGSLWESPAGVSVQEPEVDSLFRCPAWHQHRTKLCQSVLPRAPPQSRPLSPCPRIWRASCFVLGSSCFWALWPMRGLLPPAASTNYPAVPRQRPSHSQPLPWSCQAL